MSARILVILGFVSLLIACDPKEPGPKTPDVAQPEQPPIGGAVRPKDAWSVADCWKVFFIEKGTPHMAEEDEFCTWWDEDVLVLTPREGLDWSACDADGGGDDIPLTHQGGTMYRFCAKVDPHPHHADKEHNNFQIVFFPEIDGVQQNMIVAIGGGKGTSSHGGTAHSRN